MEGIGTAHTAALVQFLIKTCPRNGNRNMQPIQFAAEELRSNYDFMWPDKSSKRVAIRLEAITLRLEAIANRF